MATVELGEDATFRPLILDILRTQYCIPGSVFVLEGVEEISPTRSGRWRAIRLLLGDGELCVQALLGADLHRFFGPAEVPPVGSYIQLHAFNLISKDVPSNDSQKASQRLVYLVVEDLSVIGWCEGYAAARGLKCSESMQEQDATHEKAPTEGELTSKLVHKQKMPVGQAQKAMEGDAALEEDFLKLLGESDDSEDGFEAPSNLNLKKSPSPRIVPAAVPAAVPVPVAPVALPRDWKNTNIPLKLTNLAAIPNLPYKQNWSVNILAIVASISEAEASPLPPYRQREVRLADPSTDKRVHLTVFLDPDQFCPKAGSVVLLAGVKNHRFDGGSLKKYVSDRPRNGLSWWYEEPQFPWCQAAELRSWWAAAAEAETAEAAAAAAGSC